MKKCLLLLVLALCVLVTHAQNQTVRGKVTGPNGQPLAGASVTIKGTNLSTTTDENGNFQLSAGNVLKPVVTVTFIGFESQDYTYKGKSFTVQLNQDARTLGDVIVVGYGVQRKRDVTGATSEVKADQIVAKPIVRVEEALQGTVAGVTVQSVNGQPGAGLAVRIRGTASINNNNDPLYVIDGQIGADISTISPNDIESIEVLKDASATAIYGSRGSTGVVIISTKLGKEGKPRIDINPWVKKEAIAKELPIMNAYQFAVATNNQYTSTGSPAAFTAAQLQAFQTTDKGTDWQKALQDKPWVQNYQISVSGGSNDVKYMVSYLHLDQPGLIINQWFRTDIARANLQVKASNRLNLQFNITAALPQNRNTQYQGDITDPFAEAYEWDPTSPIRNPNGSFILESSYAALGINPIAQETNGLNDNSGISATGVGILTYRILKGLTFTSNNSYTNTSNINRQLYGPGTSAYLASASNGYALQNSSYGHSFQNSNYFTYKGEWGDHALTVTALYEQSSGTSYNNQSKSVNLSTYSLGYWNLGLGSDQSTSSAYSSSALQSYMGRIEYKFKDRYLLGGTVRDDGSSVLTQKYSVFPSGSLGWIISKENFLAGSKAISFLKLRGGYGITGNQTVGAYSSIPQIGVNNIEYATGGYPFNGAGSGLTGYTPLGGPTSTNLKWEDDRQTDIGVDAVFLNGLITFTGDYYYRKVTNLLYNLTSPYYNSGQNYEVNLGSLNNQGWELDLGVTPVNTKRIKWTTTGILSINRNKLLSLSGLDNVVTNNIGSAQTGVSILKVGKPLGEFYGYKYLGTWKTADAATAALYGNVPGDSRYLDVLGTHTINATDDEIPIGNGAPKYSFSWNNNVTFGNFSLAMLFYGTHGGQIYTGTLSYTYGGLGDARNATNRGILNVWTPENQTNIPHWSATSPIIINSSRWVYDGSYIKLKNIALTYHFPQTWFGTAIKDLQAYVSGQNVFTITKYPGYDPEISNMTNGITQGLETATIPNPRSVTFGIRAGF